MAVVLKIDYANSCSAAPKAKVRPEGGNFREKTMIYYKEVPPPLSS